jgi:hypothetical protein
MLDSAGNAGLLAIGLNAVLLGAAAFGLTRHVAKTSDAVRVRNALLLRRTRPGDFDWTPARVPADFRVATEPPAAWIVRVLDTIGVPEQPGAWEKALRIAGHLSERVQDKGRIRADLPTTYERIRAGYGYCADFARVFLAFAHAAGLFARQWAFSFDGFGGHGHVFVEVYDPQRRQWIFLDVYNNFHVVDPATQRPLSALELRALLTAGNRMPQLVRNGPGRHYPRQDRFAEYYCRGLQEWYLWWGNAAFPDDERRHSPIAGTRLRTAHHALLALAGFAPRIRVYETRENLAQVARLGGLRRRIVGAVLLCAALSVTLLVQLYGIGGAPAARQPGADVETPLPAGEPRMSSAGEHE